MSNKFISLLLLSILLLIGIGCEKKATEMPLGMATLVFPEQNSACITGLNISDSQSELTFKWNPAENATKYTLSIKNLLTNITKTYSSSTNQNTLILERNTPYSWFISSESSTGGVTTTETWKFYNSGLAIISHAPFPAELVSPDPGKIIKDLTVELKWLGTDVDNDIIGYDLYFGTTNTPPLYKNDLTNPTLKDVGISVGNTYFWKVITKDLQGNTSTSALFHFMAN